jgi:hypothetical protein
LDRIEKLIYRLETTPNSIYSDAPDVTFECPAFKVVTTGQTVEVTLKTVCRTVSEAEKVVDDFMLRWEMTAGLRYHPGEIRLIRTGEKIVSDGPLVGEQTVVFGGSISLGTQVHMVIRRGALPPFPDKDFHLSPDVVSMYTRYQGYTERREPLLSMAYMCLTILEAGEGGRKKAAAKLAVDERVLKKLGELTSTRGGSEARKADGISAPLSEAERVWVEATVKLMIARAAELPSGHPLRQLEFKDLPPLADQA